MKKGSDPRVLDYIRTILFIGIIISGITFLYALIEMLKYEGGRKVDSWNFTDGVKNLRQRIESLQSTLENALDNEDKYNNLYYMFYVSLWICISSFVLLTADIQFLTEMIMLQSLS